MILDPFTWAGLAGLFFLLAGAGAYAVRGVLDAYSIVPLGLAVAGLGVYLYAHFSDVRQAVVSRKARFGANSIVLTLIVLAILAFAQAIIGNHNQSWDFTKNHVNTLSDETQKVVKGLDQPVKLYCFFAQQGRAQYEDLLQRVRDLNPGKVSFEFVDPNKHPLLAQQYSVRNFGTTVAVCGPRNDLITGTTEEDLVNAIVKVSSGGTKTVYFTKGHQELDPDGSSQLSIAQFKKALENSNYSVKSVNLVDTQKVPADCSVLIIAGPQVDFPAPELNLVKDYLAGGGKLMALLDPRRPLKNLRAFLAAMGIEVHDDIVVDPILRIFGANPIEPITSNFDPSSPLAKDMRMQVMMPMTSSVGLASKLPEGASGNVIMRSNPTAWGYTGTSDKIPAKPGPKDERGPVTLGVTMTLPPSVFGAASSTSTAQARVVVYGTSMAFSDRALGVYNNQDLGLNSVRWLSDDASHISIAPKPQDNTPLFVPAERMHFIWLLGLLILPGLVIAAGVIMMIRRNREIA